MPRARYQRGSLKKIGHGRYRAQWFQYRQTEAGEKRVHREKILTHELGEKYRIGVHEPGPLTKANAQRLLDLLIAEDNGKFVRPDSAATVEQVARQYIALKMPRWGPHSTRVSKPVIENHIIARIGSRPIAEVTFLELQGTINRLMQSGASYSLLHKVVTFTRAIFDIAVELDIIGKNPAKKLEFKSQKVKSRRFLTLEECRRLLSKLQGRDHLIVRMFIQLGPRPEEMFALRRNDVLADAIRIDEAWVDGKVIELLKTDASYGCVYIPPDLNAEVQSWLNSTGGDDCSWLFPAARRSVPIRYENFRKRVLQPAAIAAGIGKVDLLALRRTCATHFGQRANPKDTQAQLRHADAATTMRYYQQSIPESVKEAARALEEDLGRKESYRIRTGKKKRM